MLRRDLAAEDDGFEECDDGNQEDGDGCSVTCRAEVCGNERVDADEACDDGNAVETDGCTSACVAAVCGDGIVRLGLAEGEPGFEACDDGNQVAGDGCSPTCQREVCGNGASTPVKPAMTGTKT